MLIDEKVIDSTQLEAGLKEQKKSGDFICTALVKLGYAKEEQIFSVLSHQLNIPYVKLKNIKVGAPGDPEGPGKIRQPL